MARDALPYVKKSGDTINGNLQINGNVTIDKTSSLGFTDGGSITVTPGDDTNQISIGNPHGGVAVKSNGDILLSGQGAITCNNDQIKNVKDPTEAQDVATKAYVDANAGGISVYTYSRNQNVPVGGSGYTLSSDIIIPEGFQPADTNNPTACLMYNFNTTASRCLFLGGPITYDNASRKYNINLHWYRNTQDSDVIGNYTVNFIIFIKKV